MRDPSSNRLRESPLADLSGETSSTDAGAVAGAADAPGEAPSGDATPHVYLLMEPGENRRLLAEWLSHDYELTYEETPTERSQSFDLCIVDEFNFQRHVDPLVGFKERDGESFLPILLLTSWGEYRSDPAVWNLVDDIIETPIRKVELHARIENLLRRRKTYADLAVRGHELEAAVSELRLKERAIDAAPIGVTIADPALADRPTIFANRSVERITGYAPEEVVGRNMRFLQGDESDPETVDAIRAGIERGEIVSETLVNYRKDGTQFWNRVDIAPIPDENGDVAYFVGFQSDVTDEKVREQRLSVLNRLMRHNLSNDLNIIEGYVDTIAESIEDPDQRVAIQRIKRSTDDLKNLGLNARRIDRVLNHCREFDHSVRLEELLGEAVGAMQVKYPDVDLSLSVEAGPWYVSGGCLKEALVELVENAIVHNDRSDRVVSVSTRAPDGASDRVEILVGDNGPGISTGMTEVFKLGEETQLKHGDGLGLWLVYWIVTLLGGHLHFVSGATGGTTVAVTLPVSKGVPQ